MDKRLAAKLRGVGFFSELTDEEILSLGDRVRLELFPKGAVILSGAEANERMYAVIEGEVKAYVNSADGRETVLAIRGAGQSFGELALIDGKTAPAEVAATTESLVALISKADFLDLLSSNKMVLLYFLRLMCERLREAWGMQEILHLRDASERVRRLFAKFAEERGKPLQDGETLIEVRLTHQQVADLTALTRETVTRVIDQMKRDGLLRLRNDRLYVLSKDFFSDRN